MLGANLAPERHNEWSCLLVHRFHDGTHDPGKDRTTARAAKASPRRPPSAPVAAGSAPAAPPRRLLRSVPPATPPTAPLMILVNWLIATLLQDRTDSLTAEDASNNLNDDRKNCFHVEIPPKEPEHDRPGSQDSGPSMRSVKLKRCSVHRNPRNGQRWTRVCPHVVLADVRYGSEADVRPVSGDVRLVP